MIKNRHLIFGSIYLLLTYILFFLVVKNVSFLNFSYDLLFLFTIVDVFVLLNFIIDIKKMYQYIYDKRYLLGFIFLLILVIGKYNGSSIEIWNQIIEPEYKVKNSVVFGTPRLIRGDEWLTSTPLYLTQVNTNFNSYNNILGATENLVTLFPNFPSRDISMLATPNNVGYLFLDKERAFSLSWYLPYFVLFFATFEMFMILTHKKKLYSVTGAFLVTLSPVVQWWQNALIVSYGALAVVLFYYFLNNDNWVKKLLLSIAFGYAGFLYIICLYPAWQVPYGYCYLVILIWILIENRRKLKWRNLLYIIPAVAIIGSLVSVILYQNKSVFEIMNSTVYPGSRMSTGGGEWRTLFSYVADIFYPYIKIDNPCELSQYISMYPIPTIYGIYLMIKNKKMDIFILLSSTVIFFLSIWIFFPLPPIVSKISLIYMSTEIRAQVAIGYMSIIQLIYILCNYEKNSKTTLLRKSLIFVGSLLGTFIIIKISNSIINSWEPNCVNLLTSIISLIIFSFAFSLIFINSKKNNVVLCLCLILISIVSGAIVSPINKGLKILYNKPISREIRKIVSEEPDSVFISVDKNRFLANYIAVNGAKTINTTNYVPNMKLYKRLDPSGKYNDVYNRFEHVIVDLVDDDTNFVLNYPDCITLNLSYSDICKIKVNYIVTNDQDESKFSKFYKIYNKYDISVYKTNC